MSDLILVDQQCVMDDVEAGGARKAVNGGRAAGDCLRACVATILGLDLHEVPHFVQYLDHPEGTDPHLWYWALLGFCDAHGWRVDYTQGDPPVGLSLASGTSARGHGHVCVAMDGEIVHDPHPARSGLVEIDGWFTFGRKS